MRHQYRCDVCSCYLDPGEGRICDECAEKSRRLNKVHRNMETALHEGKSGQYELTMAGGKDHEYQFI